MKFTEDSGVSMDSLFTIGCDGTNFITGINGGLIKLMEHYLERQLHWNICMLHTNELPLRHLFSNLDENISVPRCFTGPNGKPLHNCEKSSVENFTHVEVPAIVTNATDLI